MSCFPAARLRSYRAPTAPRPRPLPCTAGCEARATLIGELNADNMLLAPSHALPLLRQACTFAALVSLGAVFEYLQHQRAPG